MGSRHCVLLIICNDLPLRTTEITQFELFVALKIELEQSWIFPCVEKVLNP